MPSQKYHTFVFGYGSLMNEEDLQRTLPRKTITCRAILKGWRRKFNKEGRKGTHSYLNLVPVNPGDRIQQVEGVLIKVNSENLDSLKKREEGYHLIDVTSQIITTPKNALILTFIALSPVSSSKKPPIPRSYLKRCLVDFLPEEQERWLQETDFDEAKIDESG